MTFAFKHAFKGMALAVTLASAALASPAAASTLLRLNSASMVTTYTATINYDDAGRNLHEHATAYSNGITFNVTDLTTNLPDTLFGFCIDIFHNITLGNLGYTYLSTYGDPTDPLVGDYGNPDQPLTSNQKLWISNLVDIGFLLHRDSPGAASDLETAAIQAAIWETIHPGSVTVNNGNASVGGGRTYKQAFDYYVGLQGSGDRIYTITDTSNNPAHQTFAIGWPVEGVPEPGVWGLMLVGFFGAGAMLRRRQFAIAA